MTVDIILLSNLLNQSRDIALMDHKIDWCVKAWNTSMSGM